MGTDGGGAALEALEARLAALEARLAALEERNAGLEREVAELRAAPGPGAAPTGE